MPGYHLMEALSIIQNTFVYRSPSYGSYHHIISSYDLIDSLKRDITRFNIFAFISRDSLFMVTTFTKKTISGGQSIDMLHHRSCKGVIN
jgi:hypothetical protein